MSEYEPNKSLQMAMEAIGNEAVRRWARAVIEQARGPLGDEICKQYPSTWFGALEFIEDRLPPAPPSVPKS